MSGDSLISIKNLAVDYPISGGFLGGSVHLRVLDGIDLEIPRGTFFGLVGESGSGKTTLGRAILRAAPIGDGEIQFHDDDKTYHVESMSNEELREFRKRAQLIFQDPYAALSPRMTVRDIIAEPLEVMKITNSRQETDERVREIAAKCRLNLEHLRRFPHAFSGGQRQRISIARALVCEPKFVVADESVAALDVSIQADILNLLKSLQDQLGITFLFISHDLSVVAHTCDIVAVLYLGRLVEMAPRASLFAHRLHPYTRALLSAIPHLDPDRQEKAIKLEGEIPSVASPPSGCRFHTRCPHATERCRAEVPEWRELEPDHFVSCHFAEDLRTPEAAE